MLEDIVMLIEHSMPISYYTSVIMWEFGGLSGVLVFSFESKNGHLMDHVHATYRVAEQLLFSLNLNQSLGVAQDNQLMVKNYSLVAVDGRI